MYWPKLWCSRRVGVEDVEENIASEWLKIQLTLHIIFLHYDVYHGLYYKNSKCKSNAHNIYRNYYSKIQLDDPVPKCPMLFSLNNNNIEGGGFSKVLDNLHSPWYTHQLGRWKSIDSLIAWTFMLLFHFVVSNWVLWYLIGIDGGIHGGWAYGDPT